MPPDPIGEWNDDPKAKNRQGATFIGNVTKNRTLSINTVTILWLHNYSHLAS